MALDEKMKRELENKYKDMDTDDLMRIACANEDEYEPEAIVIAKVELKMRNVDDDKIAEVSDSKKKEDKAKEERVITTHLSKRQKFFFTILPGIAYWYITFDSFSPKPEKYIQKIKDAKKCFYVGLGFILIFVLICWLLVILKTGGLGVLVGISVYVLMTFFIYRFS